MEEGSVLSPSHPLLSYTPTPDLIGAKKPPIVVGNLPVGVTWSREHGRMLGTLTRPRFTEEGAADLEGACPGPSEPSRQGLTTGPEERAARGLRDPGW